MPGSPFSRRRSPPTRGGVRSWSFGGFDYGMARPRSQLVVKVTVAFILTALCMVILRQSSSSTTVNVFSTREEGVKHVLVTGGAGYIGSHAAMLLLENNYRVTIVDNLSRGNLGAIQTLQKLFKDPTRLQFIYADLGDAKAVDDIFSRNAFDAVIHFAAIAYVGESMEEPLRYYHNITTNTLIVVEAMVKHKVNTLIYSSTCATYGEPDKMPITEETLQVPINPYGKAKKMAEDIIKDYAYADTNKQMAVTILRYFNVIGSDPKGRLGEVPRKDLQRHGRISGACFDAAKGELKGLTIRGADYLTPDGTCIRDYIHVTDLVEAHVKALDNAEKGKVEIYNVGTGNGVSVKEFVDACKAATETNISVTILDRRPGDYAEVYSNPRKINEKLNWVAKHTNLTETLRVAWKWQKAHPDGYKIPFPAIV
ncbi:unnamed protein product [Calypogeia fissa]